VRAPDGDERTIALVLLDRMFLEPNQPDGLLRIARGERSSERELRELRVLSEIFLARLRERGELPE